LAVLLLHPNNDTVGSPTAGSDIEEYYDLQTQDTISTSVPFEHTTRDRTSMSAKRTLANQPTKQPRLYTQ